MSAIYDRLAAIADALRTVPIYGAIVEWEQPPAGVDPVEQIYLEPALPMETVDGRTTVTATWTALVIDESAGMLESRLNAQDAMLQAIDESKCPVRNIEPASIEPREPGAKTAPASIITTFTVNRET